MKTAADSTSWGKEKAKQNLSKARKRRSGYRAGSRMGKDGVFSGGGKVRGGEVVRMFPS